MIENLKSHRHCQQPKLGDLHIFQMMMVMVMVMVMVMMVMVMVVMVMVVIMVMVNMMMMKELLTHPITYQYGVHQNVQTDQSGHLDDDDKDDDDEYVDRDIITMYDNNHFSVFSTTSSFCP